MREPPAVEIADADASARVHDRRLVAVGAAMVVLPAIVAVVSVLGRAWHPSGDVAVELLRVGDVGTRHTPLVGAWSRFGWSHPGPALFWLLAPFVRLLGPSGLLVGVGLVNAAAAASCVLVAARRGGARLVSVTVLVVAVLLRSVGLDLLVDPWNPWVPLVPFVLLLLLTWSIGAGDAALLPVALAVGSFCVQTHLGYAPVVLGALVAALVLGRVRPARSTLWWSVAVVVVLWSGPVLQQVTGDHGNLSAIVESSTAPEEPVAGWSDAVGIASANLALRAPWVDGDDHDERGLAASAGPLVAVPILATLLVLVWRRRARDEGRLAVLALTGIAVGVVATSRITGILVPYLVRWWWGIGAVATLAVLAAVTASLPRRPVVVVALGASLVVTGLGLRGVPVALPEEELSRAVAGVLPDVLAALDPGERYIVRGFDRRSLDGNGVGLFAALERRGLHVFRERERGARITYGGWRLADDEDVDAVVSIVSVEDLERDWQANPRDRLIVRWEPPGARGHAVFVHPTR